MKATTRLMWPLVKMSLTPLRLIWFSFSFFQLEFESANFDNYWDRKQTTKWSNSLAMRRDSTKNTPSCCWDLTSVPFFPPLLIPVARFCFPSMVSGYPASLVASHFALFSISLLCVCFISDPWHSLSHDFHLYLGLCLFNWFLSGGFTSKSWAWALLYSLFSL